MERAMPLPFIAPVAGVSQYQDVVTRVSEGMSADVSHEPSNPYDANACVVVVAGEVVGYVPRALAARLVARGESRWRAEVTEVLRGETWGLRVRVASADDVVIEARAEAEEVAENEPAVEVWARSGRRLGVLVHQDARTVAVRGDDGLEVPYPASLVKVGEAAR